MQLGMQDTHMSYMVSLILKSYEWFSGNLGHNSAILNIFDVRGAIEKPLISERFRYNIAFPVLQVVQLLSRIYLKAKKRNINEK
jgi:hypothetical protein